MKFVKFSSRLTPNFGFLSRSKTHNSTTDSGSTTALKQAYWQLMKWLTINTDVRVWQKLDRKGHLLWYAYDPERRRTYSSDSEEEMRRWVEQRYA